MRVQIQASFISDGKVVALNQEACYIYKHTLSEAKTQKLLGLLAKTPEINPEHWEVEWTKEACGS